MFKFLLSVSKQLHPTFIDSEAWALSTKLCCLKELGWLAKSSENASLQHNPTITDQGLGHESRTERGSVSPSVKQPCFKATASRNKIHFRLLT